MSYDVARANNFHAANNQHFFLDANVWINVLTPPNNPSFSIQQYQRIFGEITANATCKIVMPSLLVSEVANRIMKGINFITFANANGVGSGGSSIPTNYYKEIYRPSPEYASSYKILFDDLLGYGDSLDLITDGFGQEISITDAFDNLDPKSDFNDHIFSKMSFNRGYIVVTDDRDFWVDGVKVVTQNSTLINKYQQHMIAAAGVTANQNRT